MDKREKIGLLESFIRECETVRGKEGYEMRKENRNLSGESLRTKKHPVRQKFMAILLCICLLLVSLPMEYYGSRTLAEGVHREILYFLDLPQEISQQTVEKGTSIEELSLPKTLMAMCVSLKDNKEKNVEGISLPERNFGVKGEGLEEKEESSESAVEGIIPEGNQAITDMNSKEEEIQQENEKISTEGQDITENSEAGNLEENKDETLPEEEEPLENQGEETQVGNGCQNPVDAPEENSGISEPAGIEPELDLEEEPEIISEETIENI